MCVILTVHILLMAHICNFSQR